ncbi:hypothetical protein F5Y17DRAFT_301784 [Xylariaceae sp. FL0594]|nr:hypothetical protein F5Y17DRAFT_301784 [Xylariaceae sp. FL0594]
MYRCGDPLYPFVINGMCCKNDTVPIILAGGTTVVCCPQGTDCDTMKPLVECSPHAFDPYGDNEVPPDIQSIYLDRLPVCQTGCCPWGYTCTNYYAHYLCVKNEYQSRQPNGKPSTSISFAYFSLPTQASTISTSSGIASSSVSATTDVTTLPSDGHHNGTDPASSPPSGSLSQSATIGIGVGVGAFVAILGGGLVYYLLRRRHRREGEKQQGYERAAQRTPVDNLSPGGSDKMGGLQQLPRSDSGVPELPVVNKPGELQPTGVSQQSPGGAYELH